MPTTWPSKLFFCFDSIKMEFISAAILSVCFFVLFVFYFVNYVDKDIPPGPYGLPIVGYLPFLGKNPIFTMANLSEKYGNIVSIRLGSKLVVILNDWTAMKEALIKQGDTFIARPRMLLSDSSFTSRDIIFGDGPIWKEQRRIALQILKEFGIGRKSMESIIMEEIEKLTVYLNSQAGKPVDVYSMFFVPVLNMIWGITVGKRFEESDELTMILRKVLRHVTAAGFFDVVNYFPLVRHFNGTGTVVYDQLAPDSQKLRDYLGKQIDEHIKNYEENNLKDFIDVYLSEIYKRQKPNEENQPPFNRAYLLLTLFDLFIAGVDTTDTTLRWACLNMALHPEIQRKVQQELDSVVAKDSFLSLSLKSLAPYTEATILELQRHPTLAPLAVPHKPTKDTTLLGYKIPKDTMIFPNIYAVQHDKKYCEDPMTFRPERFLDETGKIVTKPEWLCPFSAGPRLCLGEALAKTELHLLFTSLMRRFTFSTIPGEPEPSTELIAGGVFRMHPFKLIVTPR